MRRQTFITFLVCALAFAPTLFPGHAAAQGAAPGLVGQLGGPLAAAAVAGRVVYVTTGRRLLALDVTDPAHPTPLGQGLFLPAAVRGLAVSGSLAYVADGKAGLHVVDVSAPGSPVERGVLPGSAFGVTVSGSLAFVLGSTDLQVVDVADSAHPRRIGAFSVDGQPAAIALVGSMVYLGVQPVPMAQGPSSGGLFVLDMRDPALPVQVARFPGAVTQLLAVGGHLYYPAPDERTGKPLLHVLAIADPRAPREVAVLPGVPGFVAAAGTGLFAVDSLGLQIFDGSDPLRPRPLGAYQIPGQFRGVEGAVVAGADGYATGGDNSLHIVSISDPTRPTEVGVYRGGPSHANGVAIAGHYAYVANGYDSALAVLDVTDPARPVEVGSVQLGGGVEGVAVQGNYAYAALITGKLMIVDISDPTRPRPAGSFGAARDQAGLPADLYAVAISGHYAYIPDAVAGLQVIDVTDPAHPVETGRYPDTLSPDLLTLDGDRAYVTDNRQLLTLDVSDPAHPALLASTPLPALPLDVAVAGSHVYATDRNGFVVLSVVDPRHPVIVASDQSDSAVNGEGVGTIAVSDGLLWLTGGAGVSLYNVADPIHPVPLGTFGMDDDSPAVVRAVGATAYVTALFGGLFLLRPGAPAAAPAVPHDARYFPQTGYRIDNAVIWNYFQRRGGVTSFGYPTSRTFTFQGCTVQFFQRRIVQLDQNGNARLLNLLDSGLLNYTQFNGSTFPGVDSGLVSTAPSPTDQPAVLAWVQQHAPDTVGSSATNFFATFSSTVSDHTAFPTGGDPSLLPGIELELWGVPTSGAFTDPNNHHFIYLRWQRGIMLYDGTTGLTQGILLADYLKAMITGQNLPADVAVEAANSPYLDQYDPAAPNWVRNPSLLPNTNLANAFTPE
ncbi:MAG: hypothetical protein ACR2JY_23580 [Chloroflexota bacterium]